MSRKDEFISVDELFQKLQGVEEQMPHDAWSRMEQKLAANKPSHGGRTGRRTALASALLVLVALAGYWIWSSTEHRPSVSTSTDEPVRLAASKQETNVPTVDEASTLLTERAQEKFGQHPVAQHKAQKKAKKTNQSQRESFARKATKTKTADAPSFEEGLGADITQQPAAQAESPAHIASLSIQQIISRERGAFPVAPPITEPIQVERIIEVIKQDPSRKYVPSRTAEENAFTPEVILGDAQIVRNGDGQLFKEEKKNYQRFDLRKREVIDETGKSGIRFDTISIVRVQQLTYTPLDKAEKLQVNRLLRHHENEQAHATAGAVHRSVSKDLLVPLSDFKVKSKKTSTMDALRGSFNGLSGYFDGTNDLALALFAGGNTSFGSPSAFGLQLGLAVVYSFAERWTLSAETRFSNSYFPQLNFMDQGSSYSVRKEQTSNGWLFSGQEVIETNSYAVKSSARFALPIYFSYSFSDRLSLLAGGQLSYHLPMNWSKKYSLTVNEVQKLQVENANPFQDSDFLLDERSDFSSRLSAGYVFGLNYELSRRLSIEGRISQDLWENKRVHVPAFQGLYRNPTFEFSIGYYFGRKNKVIYYIMER